ncbi:MAG TPA: ABC transporter permease [Solirubrobacteraceae bacterium]|nr:ABC transporter permease [Solirubrobacteraceae bacterium]
MAEIGAEQVVEGVPSFGSPNVSGSAPEGGEVGFVASGWRLAAREFLSNRLAVVALALLLFFVVFCFIGPLVYHTDQSFTNVLASDNGPSATHLLGTDDNGFDELGRIMLGGQTALEIGFLSAAIATLIGTVYGAVAGLAGGLLDGFMMRIVDVMLSIPFLFIVLVLATKYSATVLEESILLGVFSWLVPARLVRGEVLTLRTRDFVIAARIMGGTRRRLVLRHLIPNALSVVIVNITFVIADSILALAYLGFLGFGLQYPAASWGDMLGNAQTAVSSGYWWLVYPVGACLVAVVMSCNLIGDALRDSLDVRLRRR